MSDAPAHLTLGQFYRLDRDAGQVQRNLEGAAKRAGGVLKTAMEAMPGPLRDRALRSLAGVLDLALATPLHDILVKGWSYRQDLAKFKDTRQYPANRTVSYDLKEVAVDSKLTPGVQLELNGAPIGPVIVFDAVAKLISKPVLLIRNAHIVGVELGALHGEGTLSCSGFTIAQRQTASVPLPGGVPLGNGIPIR